jgi:hypothetical protein
LVECSPLLGVQIRLNPFFEKIAKKKLIVLPQRRNTEMLAQGLLLSQGLLLPSLGNQHDCFSAIYHRTVLGLQQGFALTRAVLFNANHKLGTLAHRAE